ncbi:MAG: Ribosomal protein L11 methyltransferase [Candidatus Accumulibacter regalis]|jgi:ribosomal protein L11 methyltransferase|uniref:Ribosomal protein L11 methyltransferase n=1 Tax=Accumulibacter regalis TaxID=522306 RepID=A0A011PV49_ACCRE|nr:MULTISPECIES: 50S ribosomal protein L11 methyltransferase [unclassified Candidatus Accumulibacter]EXI91271.1 MAG: Ribosomal protein L11 methyltransferase [Candidatus Accumulibacter regalis]MQM33187.1 50S ribosomal protein L11 methyltransferase [Candidatus Accumulibacter phosphatis]MBL8369363.1 50S ribosomal protein L11 methyltransferase [Accumulibacter sp.]MBN8515141.1 50S ribosomal protein L11 methyltransferase [Accumulibacter sp.]MBO3703666.1 50S ribosomal protein L11 methyltransferase [A
MAWLSLSIQTDCLHAEALADALLEEGALAASIEDADAGTVDETPQFGEPGSMTRPGWERSRVVALLKPDTDSTRLVSLCAARAGLDQAPAFAEEEIAEQDWVQVTQAQFEPIRVSERLWIVPSWHDAPDPQAIVLVLDPGMAFGTGSHPTTRLCLEWLENCIAPAVSVLDYGCGSGILAIAAARLGASDVLGVDIDPQAVAASVSNAERNGVAVRFQDSEREVKGQFDIVVANILANPLKVLAPAICGHVRRGGRLALSGILAEQSDQLVAAYAPYLPLRVADTRDGWVCLAGVKD